MAVVKIWEEQRNNKRLNSPEWLGNFDIIKIHNS